MKLLIDIGNSRLKWGLCEHGALRRTGVVAHAGNPAAALREVPAAALQAVWVAHVMGAEHEAALVDAVRDVFGVDAQFARVATEWNGLHNVYREPQRLGIDRWLAMVAAWAEQRSAVCVVDAGTALTVDCVDATGRHLGGIIAAGLRVQREAVLGQTRFPVRPGERQVSDQLGTDTESCVEQGAMLACLGAIDRATSAVSSEARCYLTGGDAEIFAELLGVRWQWRRDLVLEGLMWLAKG